MSKIEDWPRRESSWAFWPNAVAAGRASSSPLREALVESNAPHLMRHSTARLLTARVSTRSQKSHNEVKSPSPERASRIAWTATWPTFLTASRPKRMQLPETTKPWSEVLTSGGSTSIPISSQRLTKKGTLSLVFITEEITAAMYSAGEWALREAGR